MTSVSNMNSALCKSAIQIDIIYCNSPITNSLTGQYQRSIEVNERFLGLSYSMAGNVAITEQRALLSNPKILPQSTSPAVGIEFNWN